jgi:hypothetical protein
MTANECGNKTSRPNHLQNHSTVHFEEAENSYVMNVISEFTKSYKFNFILFVCRAIWPHLEIQLESYIMMTRIKITWCLVQELSNTPENTNISND